MLSQLVLLLLIHSYSLSFYYCPHHHFSHSLILVSLPSPCSHSLILLSMPSPCSHSLILLSLPSPCLTISHHWSQPSITGLNPPSLVSTLHHWSQPSITGLNPPSLVSTLHHWSHSVLSLLSFTLITGIITDHTLSSLTHQHNRLFSEPPLSPSSFIIISSYFINRLFSKPPHSPSAVQPALFRATTQQKITL